MGRSRQWPNEEMWEFALTLRRGGLTYSQIEGRLDRAEVRARFGLQAPRGEDTIRRELKRRMASQDSGGQVKRASQVVLELHQPDAPATYEVNRNGWGLIEVYLPATLVNQDQSRPATIRGLALVVPTSKGVFGAPAVFLREGRQLPPGYVSPSETLLFEAQQLRGESDEPWEPLTRGQDGEIVVDILGAPVQRHPVRVADQGKFH